MTLMEVLIVIAIIGIISSVVGYKMRGSLDKGRSFKTIQNIRKVYDIFHLEKQGQKIANLEGDALKEEVKTSLKKSGLVRNPDDCLVDGWGEPFTFSIGNEELNILSSKYQSYCDIQGLPRDYPWEENTKPGKENRQTPTTDIKTTAGETGKNP